MKTFPPAELVRAVGALVGRPGVNAQRITTRYCLDPVRLAALREVAALRGLEERARHEVTMGYVPPLPRPAAQLRLFGEVVSERAGVGTASHPGDLRGIRAASGRRAAGPTG